MDDGLSRETEVTDLLHVIFSKSIRDLSTVLDTDSRYDSGTGYVADDVGGEAKLTVADPDKNDRPNDINIDKDSTTETTVFRIPPDNVLKLVSDTHRNPAIICLPVYMSS